MTDFQFTSADLTTNVTLRTDFIPFTGYQGNLTIHAKLNDTGAAKALFANFKKIKYTVSDFATFAAANNLTLTAIPISKPGLSNTIVGKATLVAPGSFAAAVISTTEIDLTWTASPGASGYVVDRATNVGFTTGVALAIFSGSALGYHNTGLTTGTHYWYRVRATGTNLTDSAYANVNATTN